jgi:hypothetical protein
MLGSSVSLIYTVTQNGCTDTDSLNMLVLDIPASVAVNSALNEACQGELINLSLNMGTSVSPFIYQWVRDNADIQGANAPAFAATISGVYKARISLSSCSLTSQEKTLTFNPLPETPVITQLDSLLTSSAATGNQWKRNGQDIPGATQQTYIVTQSGSYSVVVSNLNCQSSPSNSIVFGPTSVEGLILTAEQWTFVPNPARDRVFVNCAHCRNPEFKFHLMDATGRKVREFQGTIEDGQGTELDLRGLPSGVYWFRTADGSGKIRGVKILVQ